MVPAPGQTTRSPGSTSAASAAYFERAGDARASAIQAQITQEEIAQGGPRFLRATWLL